MYSPIHHYKGSSLNGNTYVAEFHPDLFIWYLQVPIGQWRVLFQIVASKTTI